MINEAVGVQDQVQLLMVESMLLLGPGKENGKIPLSFAIKNTLSVRFFWLYWQARDFFRMKKRRGISLTLYIFFLRLIRLQKRHINYLKRKKTLIRLENC